MEWMAFTAKIMISACLLVGASWLAGKNPVLAGFIIALPLMSLLAILFSYLQYRDMAKVAQFAQSIFVAVPLSLTFFIPFLVHKWMKTGFFTTYGLGIACLTLAYFLHGIILKSGFFR